MADFKDITPPTSADVAQWQQENKENKRKPKIKPTVFSRPPLPDRPSQGRAREGGAAHSPGRSDLPSNVFGYHEDARNPEDIIIAKEENKRQ